MKKRSKSEKKRKQKEKKDKIFRKNKKNTITSVYQGVYEGILSKKNRKNKKNIKYLLNKKEKKRKKDKKEKKITFYMKKPLRGGPRYLLRFQNRFLTRNIRGSKRVFFSRGSRWNPQIRGAGNGTNT